MSALEQSFADIAAKYDLTAITVGMNLKQGEAYRFDATAFFDGFSASGHQCAIGHGATITEALNRALTNAAASRRMALTDEAVADEALPMGEAA